jgi:phosphoribosylanthranilate isomerase
MWVELGDRAGAARGGEECVAQSCEPGRLRPPRPCERRLFSKQCMHCTPGRGRPGSLRNVTTMEESTPTRIEFFEPCRTMFRVKICGITSVEDLNHAVAANADAIGLNFYEKSPRAVSLPVASAIIRDWAAANVHRVGVFVNQAREEIEEIGNSLTLTGIQLHGDEPPDSVAHFASLRWRVIRARRMSERGVAEIAADLGLCREAGMLPNAVLVDAMTPGRYGGTGEMVSWVGLADHKRWLGDTPLVLAGGLTPDNVAEAIRIVRPAAVDVASGVESAPGKKDPAKIRDFVANALGAFEALGGREM